MQSKTSEVLALLVGETSSTYLCLCFYWVWSGGAPESQLVIQTQPPSLFISGWVPWTWSLRYRLMCRKFI